MIVAFSVAPTITETPDAEMAEAVARAVAIVRASGLPNETTAMFTTIEGEWDEVFGVIKEATEAVVAVSPRVSLVVKADIRPGRTGMLTQKVRSLEEALEKQAGDNA
ncbi:thiamine-binding protein [Corynebacterium tapiri]|uniref:Thiamine-binding protein n=1 Tax=Corynebacterium tapiri TaxID=1448266 RepID=A0A5C4U787_9CORY|nr:thiamine-binding protein [Corynebacterium tapiri]TNL99745.1 thiamine-binding protein [Corynebacterium tapiri]